MKKMKIFDQFTISILIEDGYGRDIDMLATGVDIFRNAIISFMKTGDLDDLKLSKEMLIGRHTDIKLEI